MGLGLGLGLLDLCCEFLFFLNDAFVGFVCLVG